MIDMLDLSLISEVCEDVCMSEFEAALQFLQKSTDQIESLKNTPNPDWSLLIDDAKDVVDDVEDDEQDIIDDVLDALWDEYDSLKYMEKICLEFGLSEEAYLEHEDFSLHSSKLRLKDKSSLYNTIRAIRKIVSNYMKANKYVTYIRQVEIGHATLHKTKRKELGFSDGYHDADTLHWEEERQKIKQNAQQTEK